MTQMSDFERSVGAWLDATGPVGVPDRVVEAALEEASRRRQFRVWLPFLERDFPMQTTLRLSRAPSMAWLLAILLALALAIGAALVIGAFRHPLPAPFGLAGNGVIAFDSGGQISTIRSDGSTRIVVASGTGNRSWPSFSPDGTHIASWLETDASTYSVVVARSDGTDPRRFDPIDGRVGAPGHLVWSPDSRRLLFGTHSGTAVLDMVTGKITELHHPQTGGGEIWSSDGTKLAYLTYGRGSNAEIHVVNADGTGDHRIGPATLSNVGGLTWQPGGDRLAFFAGDQGHDIYVIDSNTGAIAPVSTDPHDEFAPAWSSDGQRLAFLRTIRDGPVQGYKVVVVVDVRAGSGTATVLDPIANASLPANTVLDNAELIWSPDDHSIADLIFQDDTGSTGDNGVLVFDTSTGAPIGSWSAEGNVGAISWQRVAP